MLNILNGNSIIENISLNISGNIGHKITTSKISNKTANIICHHSIPLGIFTGGVISLTTSIGLDTTGIILFTPFLVKDNCITSKSKNTLSVALYTCPDVCLSLPSVPFPNSIISTGAE